MTLSSDWNDFCFFDTETRARPGTSKFDGDVTECGAFRYAQHAAPIMLTYCIGEEQDTQLVQKSDWQGDPMNGYLKASDMPDDFCEFQQRALRGEAWFVAWNMQFDRLMMSNVVEDCIPIRSSVDAMAQAAVSNLPLSLAGTARQLGIAGKIEEGKELIKLFCPSDGALPEERPEDWSKFGVYGVRDTDILRSAFMHTHPLSRNEWEEYWASEEINARGMQIDLEFANAAAQVAAVSREYINREVSELTESNITKVTQIARIVKFVDKYTTLPLVQEIMVKSLDEDDETGEVVVKQGLDRPRIERILSYLDDEDKKNGLTDADWMIYQLLDLRLYGGSAAPGKFAKMLKQHVDGALQGQYMFNGAAQTGRFSSRGTQVHNLTRTTLGANEEVAMELIMDAAEKLRAVAA